MQVGSSVKSSKYPGIWKITELDEYMARIQRDGLGQRHVSVKSLELVAPERVSSSLPLTEEELADKALPLLKNMAMYSSQAMLPKMVELKFTEERLYRDMLAEFIAHMERAGVDSVGIITDAMNLIGSENANTKLYDAAEKLR